MNYVWWLNQIR